MITNFIYHSPFYTIIFTASFLCWIIFELWVFSRDRGTKNNNSHDLDNKLRIIIMFVIGIGLGFNMPNIVPQFGIQNNSGIFFFLGIALVYAGILFRFWAIQTLGRFFRTEIIIQEEHKLITSGPYRYLRNPSYTGTLITFIGFGLGMGNWLSVVVLFIFVLAAYMRRIRIEDGALRERFGQSYEEYRNRTWALIPFIW